MEIFLGYLSLFQKLRPDRYTDIPGGCTRVKVRKRPWTDSHVARIRCGDGRQGTQMNDRNKRAVAFTRANVSVTLIK